MLFAQTQLQQLHVKGETWQSQATVVVPCPMGPPGRRVSAHALQVTHFSVARVMVVALVHPSSLVPSGSQTLETLGSDPALSVSEGRQPWQGRGTTRIISVQLYMTESHPSLHFHTTTRRFREVK